jgi:hypothetical protein
MFLCIESIVDKGKRAIIFNKFTGFEEKTISEGFHFNIPIVEVSKSQKNI